MPETDQNAGEQLTEHSRTLRMILRKKILKKKKKKGKRKLYAVRLLRTILKYMKYGGNKEKYIKVRGKINSQ